MMEKKIQSQLELFSLANSSNAPGSTLSNSFLSYIRNYEKTIIIIMGFFIAGIISFSLGVERGKKIIALKINSNMHMASKIQTPTAKQIENQTKYPAIEEKQEIIKSIKSQDGIYTIQVASYKTTTLAQKEAGILKKKGLSVLVTSRGKYIVVYVGNFSDRETANSLLVELRKRYRDCFIRRL